MQAPADIPAASGSGPSNPMGLSDIVLPSWNIPLYRVDCHVREIKITRHTDVLGYPVPENVRHQATVMTKLSRDHFSKPPGNSSRGALADPAVDDDDDDAPAARRGKTV